jgi:hypothetical protein
MVPFPSSRGAQAPKHCRCHAAFLICAVFGRK